ncbi:hypothetical protein Trydic_g20940 [Trypoxylus dichotomus]
MQKILARSIACAFPFSLFASDRPGAAERNIRPGYGNGGHTLEKCEDRRFEARLHTGEHKTETDRMMNAEFVIWWGVCYWSPRVTKVCSCSLAYVGHGCSPS